MAQTQYMTVPDKIELTAAAPPGGYSVRDQAAGDQRYMQIPDTITLGGGASDPPKSGSGGNISGGVPEGGANDDSNLGRLQGQADEAAREQPVQRSRILGSGETFVPRSNVNNTVELERRVRTLEDKVEHITETLQNQGRQVGGVSNFWYVVTFTGWMLVPLIAIAMYRYKK